MLLSKKQAKNIKYNILRLKLGMVKAHCFYF